MLELNFNFVPVQEMAKSMPQMDVPDVSEMLASWLGGNPKKAKKAVVGNKKRL